MRFFTCIAFCTFLFTSCKDDSPPITEQKMAAILTDLHMAESYAQLTPISQDGISVKNTETMLILYSLVLQKYQVDSTSFQQALDWYKAQPEKFDLVYEKVLNKLSVLKEQQLDSLQQTSMDSSHTKDGFKDTL